MSNFKTNFKTFFKNLFSPTNWKRWLLLSLSIVGIICAIVCGAFFAIFKQANRSIEYGEGVRYQIEAKIQNDNKELPASNKVLNDIGQSLKYRFSSTNDSSANVAVIGNGIIQVTRNKPLTDSEKKAEFENSIIKKSSLVVTDINMNPLFINGKFADPANFDKDKLKIDYSNIEKYAVPLKTDSATVRFNPIASRYQVTAKLEDNQAILEWQKATEHISKQPEKIMFMWTNLDELYRFANTPLFKNDWIAAKENAANFTFVGNRPWDPQLRKLNTIKKSQFDGSKYLVNITEINRPLNDETFVITTTDTKKSTSDALASSINFGSNKNLNLKIYGEPVLFTKEKSEFKFNYIWIALAVAFSLVSIMLMVNYGLLGSLSVISMALYIFLTLLMFTVLRGEYSPSSFAGLFASLVINSIPLFTAFNRFKYEIYKGESKVKKAYKTALNANFISSFDMYIGTLILSIIFFFLGTPNTQGFSIMITFGSIFGIIAILIINRYLTFLCVNTDLFDKKVNLLGIVSKKIGKFNTEAKYKKVNYVNKSKLTVIAPVIFISAAIITFITLASINKDAWAGFNLTGLFAEASKVNINLEFTKFGIILGISIIAIIIYSLIRFKWTYSIAIITTLVQNLLITFAVFLVLRIPLNVYTIQSFLWVILLTVANTFIIFGSVKSKMNLFEKDEALSKEQVRYVSNSIFYESFKNNLFFLIVSALVFITLIAFVGAIDIFTSVIMLILVVVAIYSTLFVGVAVWSKLEEKRQMKVQHRIDTKYWVFPNEPSEQVFPGINNYLA
ncbi:hypothetical protein JNG60_01465 [Mycoplasmopsis bovis]|uniref:protein translocase subunit SecDF n=1 Tax=Mycoplasmopsis bovis TaxID=28903 RepID=UPI001CF539E5|nr:hypothetical protein [Mycoplasmopsis bovis]UCP02842.1 hypothetical protein JNG59_01465 [Mycoplasmopsis bovis]UCP03690.1 hypothetical protein JNG60_01465 [Mycoplasmopsis bovis]